MYSLRTRMFPSFILILLGSIDCVTTVVGVLYYGAFELNPFLAGIISNIPLFTTLKLSATLCIGFTYILANKILNMTSNKTSSVFKYSNILIKTTYSGLIVFLAVVVMNNLTIILV